MGRYYKGNVQSVKRKIRIISYQIDSEKIKSPMKVAHLSDLHGVCNPAYSQFIMETLKAESPDLVVMTGDMVDERNYDFSDFKQLSHNITDQFLTFYVEGNHEQCLLLDKKLRLFDYLKKSGIKILNNNHEIILFRKNVLGIYGLVTPMEYYKDPNYGFTSGIQLKRQDIHALLGSCNDSVYSLLLAHNPLYFPSYADWGADLTLSGHIHGGIIRIPGLGGLLSPEAKFFPPYDGGLFKKGSNNLVVSRGLGNNFAFRINNPPELVFISLLPRHIGKTENEP